MKCSELAEKLVAECQDGGWRTTPDKRTIPADWLQIQVPSGMQLPAAPAAPVKKDEPKIEKKQRRPLPRACA